MNRGGLPARPACIHACDKHKHIYTKSKRHRINNNMIKFYDRSQTNLTTHTHTHIIIYYKYLRICQRHTIVKYITTMIFNQLFTPIISHINLQHTIIC